MKRPIVMVHGAFCGGWAFNRFRRPFEAAGHTVSAPDLPGHEDHPHRRHVAGLSMADYAEAVARFIAAQESPPVVIGHSLGGLVVQLAAARTRVSGLILLAPSAPWGVTGSSPEEAVSAVSLYALGPLWPMSAVDPSMDLARRYLVDRLPREGRKWVYERLRPESGRALFETLNWWLDPFASTLVPPHSIRAPVLGIAGGSDAIHPVATVRATVSRLGGSLSVAKGASHWLPGEPGWQEVAEECLDWIEGLETRAAA